jgi:hypothetical protein
MAATDDAASLIRDLPDARLDGFGAPQIAFAAAAWPMRAAEELRSALVFRALARAAGTVAMWAPWLPAFGEAMGDEVRHARLCAEVGARLGAPPPRYDREPVRRRLARLPEPRARAAALLLVEVAMGETISMSLFRAGRRAAKEPLTRAAFSAILLDEARHQRLGWSALASLLPTLGADERRALEREAASALGAFEQQIAVPALSRLDAAVPFDPACAELGVLAPEARVDGFYSAVERLVLPRLARIGIDGARAWRQRYR